MLKRPSGKDRARASLLPGVAIDKTSGRAVYWQLYDEIKRLILEGIIPAGSSMPSPRLVALEFGCSRHTVSTAYEYLSAEGLLSASHGVGTFVSSLVESSLLNYSPAESEVQLARRLQPSNFALALEAGRMERDEEDPLQTFGIPDADNFPWSAWSKVYASIWSKPQRDLTRATSPQGYPRLREAICTFVHRVRGIRATPDQVLITAGTTQSVDLLLRSMLNEGDPVWVEDPGRPKAVALIQAMKMRRVAIPVDEHGLRVDIAEERAPDARAALITPSHHYPTGATLSLERRLRLLAWASRTGGWIFEDDYDGELIADGRPLLPIYSLGQNDRIVYMGTFSKSISPQLRLGYIICNRELIQHLTRFRYFLDYFPAMNMQPVLAEFISSGKLDAYVRRMRKSYRERQKAFASQIERHSHPEFELYRNAPALFQPLGLSEASYSDSALAQLARGHGIPAFPLSPFYFDVTPKPGIIIGTGRLPLEMIPQIVENLVEASRMLSSA